MLERSDQRIFGSADGPKRFDAKRVRRILERAAAEQHRLDKELADSYTLEELEEMAAEAGISRKALREAIERRPRRIDSLLKRIPGNWSPAARGLVLMSTAGLVLLAVMLVFPEVALVLFWATIVLFVLILLGASPF